ncbi:MAG: hypothetical protein AAFP13_10740 [Pseudomonadota bacterium]
MRILSLLAVALLASSPAHAGRLICMGAAPGFMAMIEDGTGSFDYLGDGRYDFAPALTERPEGFQRLTMTTARQTWDVYLTQQSCRFLTFETDISIEFAVPTSAGDRPLAGCCIWQDAAAD